MRWNMTFQNGRGNDGKIIILFVGLFNWKDLQGFENLGGLYGRMEKKY